MQMYDQYTSGNIIFVPLGIMEYPLQRFVNINNSIYTFYFVCHLYVLNLVFYVLYAYIDNDDYIFYVVPTCMHILAERGICGMKK